MVGIATVAKASFALMDGIIAMEGPGPANGSSLPMGLILASTDLVALDYAQTEIMGYNPTDVPIVAEGLKRGLGKAPSEYPNLKAHDLIKTDYKRIEVQKKTRFFHALILPFFAGPFVRWRVKRQRRAPFFLKEECILCKKCIQICPVDALKIEEKHIVIDEKRCIRCYCCHEVCPASAILVDEEIPS
jgi:ferredoxin